MTDIFGGWESVVVISIVMILFGLKRLGDFMSGLRLGIREFREAARGAPRGLDQPAGEAGQSLGGIHGKLAGEALTTDNQTVELYDPAAWRDREGADDAAKRAAQGRWVAFWLVVARIRRRDCRGAASGKEGR